MTKYRLLLLGVSLLAACGGSRDSNSPSAVSSPSTASGTSGIACPPGQWLTGDKCEPIPEPDDPLDAWVQTGGPPAGGDILVEIDSNGTIYVAALGGGLFRSNDGESWSLTNVFVPRYYSIVDLQIEPTNPQTLWAQTKPTSPTASRQ
jgi:hypothetical protein